MLKKICFDKTPFNIAVERGNIDIVRFILSDTFVDVNIRNILNSFFFL